MFPTLNLSKASAEIFLSFVLLLLVAVNDLNFQVACLSKGGGGAL